MPESSPINPIQHYRATSILILCLIFSALTLFTEFRSFKEDSLFTGWLELVPFAIICVLTLFLIIKGLWLFFKDNAKFDLIPLVICIATTAVYFWHIHYIQRLDESETNFNATTNAIGSDGGLYFDFKKNGHLKVEKQDHWMTTDYWGSYTQNRDTIILDIPLNFHFGKKGILDKATLRMLDDTVHLSVTRTLSHL